MKSAVFFLLVAVTVVSAAVTDVIDPETRDTRLNGIGGGLFTGSRLLRSFIVSRVPQINAGAVNVWVNVGGFRITAFRARELSSQNARVRRIGGGLGTNFIVLQFVNAPRRGFRFSVQIWGR